MFRSEVSQMLKNFETLRIKNDKDKLRQDFLNAVKQGQTSKVKLLLSKGVPAHIFNDKGDTLLTIAAEKNDIATAKILLKYKPELLNFKNNDGSIPFDIVERKGQAKFAEFLLEHMTHNKLITAVIIGDTEKVKMLLTQNISADTRDMNGRHLLAIAADKGHDKIVKLLIDSHPKLTTMPSADGMTPLFLAASKGHIKVVALLAEQKSVNVNESIHGLTPLYMAAAKGYHAVVKCLLEHGANPNQTYKNQQTTLSAAISGSNANITASLLTVESLLIHKAEVNNPDADGMQPFDVAVHYQQVEICQLLLKYHAEVDVHKNDSLFKALSNHALLALLLASKVDINKTAGKSYHTCFFNEIKKGATPLLAAIHVKEKTPEKDIERLQICEASIHSILDHKPDVNFPDELGTPLHHAVSLGDMTLAHALLQQKANVNVYSDKILSPLIIAAIKNNNAMVKLLIEYNVDLELTGTAGASPLIHAVINSSDEVVVTLLENKADINKMADNGLTPLCYAITKHYKNLKEAQSCHMTSSDTLMKDFFENDRALTDKQKQGLTTALKPNLDKIFNMMESSKKLLYMKKVTQSEKIIKTLIDHKASVNTLSHLGSTPLTLAVECQLNDVLKTLLESKMNVDVNMQTKDKSGYTALHEAAILGNEIACQLLLDHKADVNKLDNNGMSPLYYAVLNAHDKVVKILLTHGANLKYQEKYSMIEVAEYLGNKNILNILKKLVFDHAIEPSCHRLRS